MSHLLITWYPTFLCVALAFWWLPHYPRQGCTVAEQQGIVQFLMSEYIKLCEIMRRMATEYDMNGVLLKTGMVRMILKRMDESVQ